MLLVSSRGVTTAVGIVYLNTNPSSLVGVCGTEGVRGYPTVKYIDRNEEKSVVFQGQRSLDRLLHFTEKMSQPAVKLLEPTDEEQDGTGSRGIHFVMMADKVSHEDEISSYTAMANNLLLSSDFYLRAQEKTSDQPKLILHKVMFECKQSTCRMLWSEPLYWGLL